MTLVTTLQGLCLHPERYEVQLLSLFEADVQAGTCKAANTVFELLQADLSDSVFSWLMWYIQRNAQQFAVSTQTKQISQSIINFLYFNSLCVVERERRRVMFRAETALRKSCQLSVGYASQESEDFECTVASIITSERDPITAASSIKAFPERCASRVALYRYFHATCMDPFLWSLVSSKTLTRDQYHQWQLPAVIRQSLDERGVSAGSEEQYVQEVVCLGPLPRGYGQRIYGMLFKLLEVCLADTERNATRTQTVVGGILSVLAIDDREDPVAHFLLRQFDLLKHRTLFDIVPHLFGSLVEELSYLCECCDGLRLQILTDVLSQLLLQSDTALFASGAGSIRNCVSCLPSQLARLVDVRISSIRG